MMGINQDQGILKNLSAFALKCYNEFNIKNEIESNNKSKLLYNIFLESYIDKTYETKSN